MILYFSREGVDLFLGVWVMAGGLVALTRGSDATAMIANAATLIGAGLLIGGAGIELMSKYETIAGPTMAVAGVLIAVLVEWRRAQGPLTTKFVLGAIFLMGLALHLVGLGFWAVRAEIAGLGKSMYFLYAAAVIALAGWRVDVRFVTALALVPFAQMLDTGTIYFHAMYVFYSPESTLSILQMTLLIGLMLWWSTRVPERDARHMRIVSVLAFVVANLCALVGSLWGDVVGETVWGPMRGDYETWQDYGAARDAFRETALTVSAETYSVIWAIALAAIIAWAAHRNNRGLFNTGMTFAGIHAYTQLFETFGDEPLAWVIGGFGAIAFAWGLWRLNQFFVTKAKSEGEI